MPSPQTELKVAQFLKAIIQGEKQLEAFRQVLVEQKGFDPYLAFNHLDKDYKGSISPFSFCAFLSEHNINVTDSDLVNFFSTFDTQGAGRIPYSSFLNIILPRTCLPLRQLSCFKKPPKIFKKKPKAISYEVQWALARVFDQEMNFMRKIELLKDDLGKRGDFVLPVIFSLIDSQDLGALDIDSLYIFLKKNKVPASENDVLALLRRADHDNDGKLSYTEFTRMIVPITTHISQKRKRSSSLSRRNSVKKITTTPSKTKPKLHKVAHSASKGHRNNNSFAIHNRSSSNLNEKSFSKFSTSFEKENKKRFIPEFEVLVPKKKKEAQKAPETPSVFTGNTVISKDWDLSPVKFQDNNSVKLDFEDNTPLRMFEEEISETKRPKVENTPPHKIRMQENTPTKRSLYKNPLWEKSTVSELKRSAIEKQDYIPRVNKWQLGDEEESFIVQEDHTVELASVFKEMIELEREIENNKNELALQIDFNLLDTFKLFDKESKGFINKYEFEDGLAALQVSPSPRELDLLVRRFDRNQDGFLRYSDFCNILMPKQIEYSEILGNRLPLLTNKRKVTDPSKILSTDTTFLLRKTLNTLLSNETYGECLRQRLHTRPGFSIYRAFKALDKNRNGFIGIEDIKDLLNENGFYACQKELLSLMGRLDKNQDGRVSYNEFVEELRPKILDKNF